MFKRNLLIEKYTTQKRIVYYHLIDNKGLFGNDIKFLFKENFEIIECYKGGNLSYAFILPYNNKKIHRKIKYLITIKRFGYSNEVSLWDATVIENEIFWYKYDLYHN